MQMCMVFLDNNAAIALAVCEWSMFLLPERTAPVIYWVLGT